MADEAPAVAAVPAPVVPSSPAPSAPPAAPPTADDARKILAEDQARRMALVESDIRATLARNRCTFDIEILPVLNEQGLLGFRRVMKIEPLA